MGVKNQLKGVGTLQQVTDNGNAVTDPTYSLILQANGFLVTNLDTSEQVGFSVEGFSKNDSTGLNNQNVQYEEITSSETLTIPNESGTIATREWVTKGLVQKTTTEINAIASPTEGEQYYNTTLHTICFYNGTTWQKMTSTNM